MKFSQFRRAGQHEPKAERVGSATLGDGLEAFGSEQDSPSSIKLVPTPASAPQPKPGLSMPVVQAGPIVPIAAALLGLVIGGLGIWGLQRFSTGRAPATLRIETTTPGVDVLVSGKTVGRTPVSLTLAPGVYPVQLAGAGGKRDFSVTLAGGTSVVRNVDMPTIAAAPDGGDTLGSLAIQTDPDRLPVTVDGVDRGVSPLTLSDLKPGEHLVAVRTSGTTVRRTVTVVANERTVLLLSPSERAAPAAASSGAGGWLTVASPVALTIREAGKVIGTTESDRLMLPAGDHSLELVNDGLAFLAKRSVKIEPGKTAVINVDPPNGIMNINAQPWAEVWVDGQRIGETPIGNLSRPVGPHEVVLRHPEFGERRETVMVTLKQPARLGVDMRRK
jgi:PEGA domain